MYWKQVSLKTDNYISTVKWPETFSQRSFCVGRFSTYMSGVLLYRDDNCFTDINKCLEQYSFWCVFMQVYTTQTVLTCLPYTYDNWSSNYFVYICERQLSVGGTDWTSSEYLCTSEQL